MPSVIIPAHNEEALIADCIRGVLDGGVDDLEIIVVPNACSDRTAEIARSFGHPVRVIETDTPGKTNALNLAERYADAFPRAFIDGDIVLRPGALAAVFAALRDGVHIASPPPEFDCSQSDPRVAMFYRSLTANSYFSAGSPNGSGVFAVTREGRSRWGEFPKVIADDGFVELHFAPNESVTADGPAAIVQAPRTFKALLDIKARGRLGRHELAVKFPNLSSRPRRASLGGTYRTLLATPSLWATIPVYTFVRIEERRRAKRLAAKQGYTGWLRDDTSRAAPAANPGSAP